MSELCIFCHTEMGGAVRRAILCSEGHVAHLSCIRTHFRTSPYNAPVCARCRTAPSLFEGIEEKEIDGKDVNLLLQRLPLDLGDDPALPGFVVELRKANTARRAREPSATVAVASAPRTSPIERHSTREELRGASKMLADLSSDAPLVSASSEDVLELIRMHTAPSELTEIGIGFVQLQRAGVTMQMMLVSGYTAAELGTDTYNADNELVRDARLCQNSLALSWVQLVALHLSPDLLRIYRIASARRGARSIGVLGTDHLVQYFGVSGATIYRSVCHSQLRTFMGIDYTTEDMRILQCPLSQLVEWGLSSSYFAQLAYGHPWAHIKIMLRPTKADMERVMANVDAEKWCAENGWTTTEVLGRSAVSAPQPPASRRVHVPGAVRFVL